MHLTPPDELTGIDRRLRSLAGRSLLREVRRGRRRAPLRARARPGRRVFGDHEGAPRRPARALRIMARCAQRAGRARGLPRRAGAQVPERAASGRPGGRAARVVGGERLAAAGIRAWKRADTPASVNLLGRATALLRPTTRSASSCSASSAWRRSGRAISSAAETTWSTRSRQPRPRTTGTWGSARKASSPAPDSSAIPQGARQALELAEPSDPYLRGARRRAGHWGAPGATRLRARGMKCEIATGRGPRKRPLFTTAAPAWSGVRLPGRDSRPLSFYGPTPVPDRSSLRRATEEATDRAGPANVLAFMGGAG